MKHRHETPAEAHRRRSNKWYHDNKTLRAERREQTRQAVEELLKTRHSVKELVQAAFEANGGEGDAGARVL